MLYQWFLRIALRNKLLLIGGVLYSMLTFLVLIEIWETNSSKHADSIRILQNIFEKSLKNGLTEETVLAKTLAFMLEERDEYDNDVIEFVKSIILKPDSNNQKQNFENKKSYLGDVSATGQSEYIDKLLGSQRNGFFIEAGAHDGESVSNSLFFEVQRNWTGILIEPTPNLFRKLVSKKRHAYALNACLAGKHPRLAKFILNDFYTGQTAEWSKEYAETMKKKVNTNATAYLPCFSINTVLKALDVTNVDYFSLDVEGGELSVLRDFDFENIHVRTFSIEVWGESAKADVTKVMVSKGYELMGEKHVDLYFRKL